MIPRRLRPALSALPVVALVGLTAGACSTASPSAGVVTSFYPLQFATQQIVGGGQQVGVLTKPGAEPHDLELAPQDLARMTKARLVVYADGFQPAVDDAMGQVDASHVLDVAGAARLTLPASEDGHDHAGEGSDASAGSGDASADDAHASGDGHDHGADDPHFWLDPARYADVAKAIGARLAHDDPANAPTYEKNTAAFVAKLTALDTEYRTGLASCRSPILVTSHAAFGYLAQRYGLDQHGIAGISPEAEPSAAGLKQVSDLVRSEGVTTIFQETLVEPQLADTVARTTGAAVTTLDPVEGITGASAGKDYFEVMRSNLTALRKGLGCQ
ncbi:metal ABC transporter substrate-binding protein [Intrasporangium sp. YIM S08009]|uniref:metal ABC transporter substrate-binding protein n=1 Tax=Intrasporangium zincisolvens TaxID=3080018 RepID=UPI002B05248A|nr:metal ABC transporter substrate-binding protein [Intrasporangium sp. YIM S08009]